MSEWMLSGGLPTPGFTYFPTLERARHSSGFISTSSPDRAVMPSFRWMAAVHSTAPPVMGSGTLHRNTWPAARGGDQVLGRRR